MLNAATVEADSGGIVVAGLRPAFQGRRGIDEIHDRSLDGFDAQSQRLRADRFQSANTAVYMRIPILNEPIDFLEMVWVIARFVIALLYCFPHLRKQYELSVILRTCTRVVAS